MSFQNVNLGILVDQFTKKLEEIKEAIPNISDRKTLMKLKENFSNIQIIEMRIRYELDKGVDPNCDIFRVQYNQACSEFYANQKLWDSILKKEESKYQKYDEEEREKQVANISEEQLQEKQQSDELDYVNNQLVKINKEQKDINVLSHILEEKVIDDHNKVEKIVDHVENAKNEMDKGNKELDKAEKDQKKCNIC